jgi:hypothetical protein
MFVIERGRRIAEGWRVTHPLACSSYPPESGSDQNKTLINLKIGFIKPLKTGLRLIFPASFLALSQGDVPLVEL